MKWGFLADNIVNLCKYHRLADHIVDLCKCHQPAVLLGRKWRNVDLAQGAIDFLDLALEGVENYGCLNFPGGIGSVVESLTLYGWATEALGVSSEDKNRAREEIAVLLQICKRWQGDELLSEEEISQLEKFSSAIARITLREANKVLDS